MPPRDVAELPCAPRLTLQSWASLFGPGLVMAGAAAYLARAGLTTVVCERRDVVGGAAVSEILA